MKVDYYANGKIFTGQDETRFVSALGVADGKFVWTGETAEIKGEYIDLEGKTVLPGFIDSHIHPVYVASVQNQVPCMPPFVNSIDDMVQALKKTVDDTDPDSWIDGWGFDESKLAEGTTPTKEDLDRVSTTHPVQIIRSCFHARVLNSRALEIAKINRDTPDIPEGIIEKDDNGEPTGALYEAAHWYVENFRKPVTRENSIKAIVDLTHRFASLGITGVTEVMGRPEDYEMYMDAKKTGFKQHIAIYNKFKDYMDSGRAEIKYTDDPEETVRFTGLKFFLDGSISGHTAFMKEPYPNSKDRGIPLGSEKEMDEMYEYAKDRNLQIIIHAMGDSAIQFIIDYFKDKASWVEGAPSVRIEHCSILSDEMIDEIGSAGIGVTMNVDFLYAEYDSWRKNLDDKRFNMATRLGSSYGKIEHLALASDSPATLWAVPEDVFMSLKAAVTRKAHGGQDINQAEKISVDQAILLYTKRAAIVCNIPLTGQIIPGYHADFIILDKDIFNISSEDIDKVKVVETFIKGEQIYKKKE